MRNLKRALSLTLASVMLLGMMVVGSSAAAGYSDVDENDNVEAIEVLQAVKVMVGDDRGFGPDRPVTRNEMAVVMGKLLNLDYNYYSETCPFTDVADWAKGWVGAAAANGIVSGRGNGIYDGEATVTAVEAASMMMRALGYFKYQNDYADGFQVSTVRQGTKIGIFDQVGTDATSAMTRNQVAQMALNALQCGMVEPDGNTINLTTPDGSVFTGKVNYVNVTSYKDFARAISETQASSAGSTNLGYIVELGEQLYNGKLKLEDGWKDDFLRPSRKWEYDGKEIGTYMKKENIRREYTAKVTGKDIYDLLGAATIKDYAAIHGAIDGKDTTVSRTDLVRTNTDAILETEKGVLTQVFVDTEDKVIDIVAINTYLAKATEDYDAKNGEVDLDVYALDETDDSTPKNPDYIKNKDLDEPISVTVDVDDIDVSEVKEDDFYLITVAQGKVQTMADPEVISAVEIDSFKKNKDVTVEGTTYEYADTAKYDPEVLDDYNQTNMKDATFNIFLDKYGYLIGIEQNEEADQYVFLTGLDGNYSYLSNKNADANVIFMDGRMETITVNTRKSKPIVDTNTYTEGGDWTDGNGTARNYSQINTWCTYSVDSKGVYTLKEVATFADDDPKVMQKADSADGYSNEIKIDRKNVTLPAISGKAYGNDDTVYINVELEGVDTKADANSWYKVIDDVDSVTTGTKNVSLKISELGAAGTGADKDNAKNPTNEVYTLYKDNGYIIAAVTIGEDDGATKTYAYITSDSGRDGIKRERYDKANDEWTWIREAVVDGKLTDLKEVGGGTDLSKLEDMTQNTWYELKLDSNGSVKDAIEIKRDQTTLASPPHSGTSAGTAAYAKDDVFCTVPAHFGATNDYPKYVGKAEMVDNAINDNDTVILFQNGFTAPADGDPEEDKVITYKNGTLYVGINDVKGFDVSPEVKTVLCLSDGEGGDFDDVIDSYEGYKGLENAIRNLDSNFTGDLSVVFDKGSAVVIIFNDTTDAADVDEPDEPAGPAKVVGQGAINTTDPDDVTLEVYVYGDDEVGASNLKKYLKDKYGGEPTQKNGRWSFGTEDDSYEGVTITQTQVWKVSMASTWKDAASDGTDKALITAATVDSATLKVGSDIYVKATGTVKLKVTVGTLTTNTTLTIQVANSSATLAASTKNLNKDTAGDHDATVTVTTGALSDITKDIELNVKVTDT